jgi:hypothetical protein
MVIADQLSPAADPADVSSQCATLIGRSMNNVAPAYRPNRWIPEVTE